MQQAQSYVYASVVLAHENVPIATWRLVGHVLLQNEKYGAKPVVGTSWATLMATTRIGASFGRRGKLILEVLLVD